MVDCLVHKYINDVVGLIDGANLYYVELSNLLNRIDNRNIDINIVWHDLFLDLKKGTLIEKLKKVDAVLCCAGPYAYIYHYFREKYGLNFRIIRDVQTSYWGGYLLQEFLCKPLSREGDLVIVPSYYTIYVLRNIFKTDWYLNNSIIFYPSVDEYPCLEESKNCWESQTLKIGYLGRISKDKNFDQVIELSKKLAKDINVELFVAGGVYRNQFNLLRLKKDLEKYNVRMHYMGYVKNIWHFFKKFDVFVFFSTSNVESLGRVVLEAINARKKILAAKFGAMPELLPPEYLLPVNYFNLRRTCNDVFPLGRVDLSKIDVTLMLELKPIPLKILDRYRNCHLTLIKFLYGKKYKAYYHKYKRHYDRLPRVINISTHINKDCVMMKAKKVISFLLSQEKLSSKIKSTFKILYNSKNKKRSLDFLTYYWRSRVTYSTLGHYPIESCWIIKFNPILEV